MQANLMQLSGVDLIVPIHGIEGAKAYPLGANCRAPLFDDSDDVFYIKSTDANGFPTVKKYRFTEELIIDPNNSGNGVALQDIRAMIREELQGVKEELINAKQSVSTASGSESQYDEPSNTAAPKRRTKHAAPTASTAGSVVSEPSAPIMEHGQEQQ